MEIKDVYVDADHLLYDLASPPAEQWKTTLKGKNLKSDKADLRKLKALFKDKIIEYETIAIVESIGMSWEVGETHVVISDKSNFRYDIFPDYKKARQGKEHTERFIKLRKWARKKWSPKQNIEADDKVAYYVRNGAIGFSADKDLLKGVAGIWFDVYHLRRHWVHTSEPAARRFNLLQCVAGDTGDGIQGIYGVGFVKAETLLNKHGWDWDGVVKAYEEKGLTEYDAIMTRRLVSMDQWSHEKGLRIFGETK